MKGMGQRGSFFILEARYKSGFWRGDLLRSFLGGEFKSLKWFVESSLGAQFFNGQVQLHSVYLVTRKLVL